MNAETLLSKSSNDKSTLSSSHPKNVFTSGTVWGIIFTTIAAIAPIVGKDIDQYRNHQPVNYGEDTAKVVVILCGAAATVCGRVSAKDPLYTPDWLPGPNKSDLEPRK